MPNQNKYSAGVITANQFACLAEDDEPLDGSLHHEPYAPPHGGEIHRSIIRTRSGCHNDAPCPSADVPDACTGVSTMDDVGSPNGFQKLKQVSLSYPKWCAEVIGMVLKTRTPFAAYLSKTIQLSRDSRKLGKPAPTFFPIPIPHFGVFGRKTCKGSAVSRHNLQLRRVVHLVVAALNFWYAGGRYGEMELLQREPSKHHLDLYRRIKLLIESDGPAVVESLPKAGRRFPELAARLGELSDALTKLGSTSNPYEKSYTGIDVSKSDHDEGILKPYHDCCPEKLKLFGKGSWDPSPFLGDDLCVAFKEPKVLLHHQPAPEGPQIRDTPETMARLARSWDDLGLLTVHKTPIHPSSRVRIFGAYKDASTHRQIGDRRGQNGLEAKVLGPSHDLPSGADLCEVFVDPRTSRLHISITDRKDFYHQLECTRQKAIANTIGPAIPEELLSDTRAYSAFLLQQSRRKYDRQVQGDQLRGVLDESFIVPPPGQVWCAFNAVLQGDHAGVEIATEAHRNLLQANGLLDVGTQLRASRPLFSSDCVEGLVIDDYFCVSVEPRQNTGSSSRAKMAYNTAEKVYHDHGLMGSPHKDIIDQDEGRVIGAYLNSSPRALSRGLVTVGAPPEKRLAISHLTLELCRLRSTTDALHLCLIGGWVSILGHRRPLMSVLQESFRVVEIATFDRNNPKIIPLTREVANELTLLSVLMPLALCELSAPFADAIYCTDASNERGAVLQAPITPELSEIMWRVSRSKGAYSRLLSPIEVILKRLDALEEKDHRTQSESPERPLAFSFEFIEVFSGAAKISHFIAIEGITPGPPLDIGESPQYDLRFVHVISWITHLIVERRLLGFFLGPPCTTFSIMRRPRLRSKQVPFGFQPFEEKTQVGNQLAHRSFQTMGVAAQCDSCGMLETPYSSYMKGLPSWQYLKSLPDAEEVRCDSCRFQSPHLKSFRLLGLRLDMDSLSLHCQCQHKHVVVEGSLTKSSATYTDALACQIAKVISRGIAGVKSRIYADADVDVSGLESQLSNELMLSSRWEVKSSWRFRKPSHINILEEAALLKLCNQLAIEKAPVRCVDFVDSNVVRCATAKGRSSSLGLSPILRRVSAVCVASGIYMSVPFTPTRLNCADDPTRLRELRMPLRGLNLEFWSRRELFLLASLPKLKRWASNWVRLVLRFCGTSALFWNDRSLYRRGNLCNMPRTSPDHSLVGFDSTLGFPGEGPFLYLLPFTWFFIGSCLMTLWTLPRPCRWTFSHTGLHACSAPLSFVSGALLFLCSPFGCFLLAGSCWGAASAMPISAATPGELRRAQTRSGRGPLQPGRPVTEATNSARLKFWNFFVDWSLELDINIETMLDNHHLYIDDINLLLTKYGRELYDSGKSYNQYAETINAVGARKPAIRRMLQQAWDLGYAWVRSEPSVHHVAVPVPIILAMTSVAMMWGWIRVAGCLALGFSAMLRPGEIVGAFRRDLLLPKDSGYTMRYALLSIREPKSRFTYARHQTAKADSEDFLQIIELAFNDLSDAERLWPSSAQTLRQRFKTILRALHLPDESRPGERCLDLGSLRSGGATFIITATENSELVRRRGRWASNKMMDIYIQESMAIQYMKMIPEQARMTVLSVAGVFPDILRRAKQYHVAKIPLNTWFFLFSS